MKAVIDRFESVHAILLVGEDEQTQREKIEGMLKRLKETTHKQGAE